MILLGVGKEDTSQVAAAMAEKVANLRIFEDEQGKMNRSLLDVKGSALVVSQFTLYGDARGQRRPSYIAAAAPELAKGLYRSFRRRFASWEFLWATSLSGHDVRGAGE